MFFKMLAFEWRYFVRQPSFYVTCLVFFLLPYFAMVSDNVRIGSGGNVLYNSSYAISMMMLIMSIFSMFLVVNFIGNTATRNESSQFHELIYAKPIKPLPYLTGRFAGAFLIVVTVFAMVPLGNLIGTFMPWVDSERLGPTNLSFYLTTFFYINLPTLFVFSCIFYAVALRFRSLMAVYLAAVTLFISYLIGRRLLDDPEYRTLSALADPFGRSAFDEVSRYWTAFEKNNAVIEFSGILLQNRLLWVAIGVAILLVFGRLHKQLALPTQKAKKKSKDDEKQVIESAQATSFNIAHKAQKSTHFKQFLTRTKFEVKQVCTSPAFYILLLVSGFNMMATFLDPFAVFGAPNWPLTQDMVELIMGAFSLLTIVIVTYYSAEVVWRERSSGMGDIVDSMPVFNLIFWSSKILAVFLVILSLNVLGMFMAISYQLIKGYPHLELAQYLTSLLFFGVLPWCLNVVAAFFIQVHSPNKYIGMMVFVGFIILGMTLNQWGFEHNMWNYSAAPFLQYSDMNGYGWYLQTQSWYMLYWGSLALALSIVGFGIWQRGPQVALKARYKLLSYQIKTQGKVMLACALTLFVLSGSYIYYNTRVLNDFVTSDQGLDLRAEYEKKYGQFRQDNVPAINKVNASIDIYPSSRTVIASIDFTAVNDSAEPISRFLISYPSNTPTWEFSFEGGKVSDIDKTYNTATFTFETPLAPGESRTGTMSVKRENKGFKDNAFDTSLVNNGTFLNNYELFPFIGYNARRELTDRHERRKRELPPPKRANKLEDESFYHESFFGKGVGFIDFEATVSTEADQFAITPGYLQKEWVEGERRYFHYKMDSPMIHFYSVLSARLDVKKEKHKGVDIEVYYHPSHDMNIDRMIESTKDSLDYFTEHFGPYQHKQMRIIEFPGYRSFAQSFANTVPYSEQIGFITDLRDPENVDPVYYVTAHEVAHQWWAHQVGAANVQGSAILSETLSQYSAIMVLTKKYGEHKLRKFLTYELDRYLRGRTQEILEEMPLLRAENQPYIHYRKGSVVMMAIKDRLGEARVNEALQGLLNEYKFKDDPYPTTLDLMRYFESVSSDEEMRFIENQFNEITLYDLVAKSAEVTMDDNNEHDVTLTIDAKRFVADGKGEETEAELNEYIDIVLFSGDPNDLSSDTKVLYQQKHLLTSGENVITIHLPELPDYAGVDPFVKLIDRDSANNIIRL